MKSTKRKQFYIREDQQEHLTQECEKRHISETEYIRRLIDKDRFGRWILDSDDEEEVVSFQNEMLRLLQQQHRLREQELQYHQHMTQSGGSSIDEIKHIGIRAGNAGSAWRDEYLKHCTRKELHLGNMSQSELQSLVGYIVESVLEKLQQQITQSLQHSV